jgi:hypothetical protein
VVRLDDRVLAQLGSSVHFRILAVYRCTYLLLLGVCLDLAVDGCAGALLFALLRQLALPL